MLVKHALKVAIATALLGAVLQGSEQIAYFVYPVMGLVATMQSSLGGTVKAAWGRLGGSAIAGANLPKDLQIGMQAVAQANILSFNNLAAAVAQQSNQQQFSSPLPTFDAVEQALLKLRTSGPGLSESLDQVISFVTVLLAMQEIAENLKQMAADWSLPAA